MDQLSCWSFPTISVGIQLLSNNNGTEIWKVHTFPRNTINSQSNLGSQVPNYFWNWTSLSKLFLITKVFFPWCQHMKQYHLMLMICSLSKEIIIIIVHSLQKFVLWMSFHSFAQYCLFLNFSYKSATHFWIKYMHRSWTRRFCTIALSVKTLREQV